MAFNTASKFLFLSSEQNQWDNLVLFARNFRRNGQDHMNMKPET